MDGRGERITRETEALWRAVFDRPPEPGTDSSAMLEMIMSRSEVPTYQRLNRPHLRDAGLVFPKQPSRF